MTYLTNAKNIIFNIYSKHATSDDNLETYCFDKVASMIPNTVDVDTLVLAIKMVLNEIYKSGEQIELIVSSVFALIAKECPFEFALKFREKYIKEIIGIEKETLKDENYGYIEVKEDVIDISNKDKGELLAALYNESIPFGMGFIHYDPNPWTSELAWCYLDNLKNKNSDEIRVTWILGRRIPCYFKGNLLYVAEYNHEYFPGLAQKIISTCKNVTVEKGYPKVKISDNYN